MFWDSVLAGLKILAYWEVYLAGLEYLAIYMIPMVVIAVIGGKFNETGEATAGCLSMTLIPLLQMAAMIVFVLTLAPIILGLSENAAWSFPWAVLFSAPGMFFKLIGTLVISLIILAFIPFIRSQSLDTLVLGGIILIFSIRILGFVNPDVANSWTDFIPGFWFSVGLLIMGGAMWWVGLMITGFLANGIRLLINPQISENSIMPLIIPIGTVFQFIPVFMYGSWLGIQIRNGVFGIPYG